MTTWLARDSLGVAPGCARSAKVGLLSTATGFAVEPVPVDDVWTSPARDDARR